MANGFRQRLLLLLLSYLHLFKELVVFFPILWMFHNENLFHPWTASLKVTIRNIKAFSHSILFHSVIEEVGFIYLIIAPSYLLSDNFSKHFPRWFQFSFPLIIHIQHRTSFMFLGIIAVIGLPLVRLVQCCSPTPWNVQCFLVSGRSDEFRRSLLPSCAAQRRWYSFDWFICILIGKYKTIKPF